MSSAQLDDPLPCLTTQALHFILLSLITILHTIYIGDIVIFAIHLAMCLAFLIYIPAAFGISLSRKKSRFDRAGGEVAYLVVQQLGWLGKFSSYL